MLWRTHFVTNLSCFQIPRMKPCIYIFVSLLASIRVFHCTYMVASHTHQISMLVIYKVCIELLKHMQLTCGTGACMKGRGAGSLSPFLSHAYTRFGMRHYANLNKYVATKYALLDLPFFFWVVTTMRNSCNMHGNGHGHGLKFSCTSLPFPRPHPQKKKKRTTNILLYTPLLCVISLFNFHNSTATVLKHFAFS